MFVDIDSKTLNIDPTRIEKAITPRTKAILPVHAFGQPADMDPIIDIARRHGLRVIEDSCEALGATHKGRPAGSLGDAAVFAFYPNKQITTGEGGVIVTDDDNIALLCRSMRNQGRGEGDHWLEHTRLGYNYRLDELSAALGLSQMRRLVSILSARESEAARYSTRLAGLKEVKAPYVEPSCRMSWFVYVIQLQAGIDRDKVMAYLSAYGVGCRLYFTPIHLQPFYREKFGFKEGDFSVTESVARSTIALPFFNNLDDTALDYVVETLTAAVESAKGSAQAAAVKDF